MNIFTQIRAVTMMSLSTLPQRLGTSFVIIAGTAGVVAVLISILALSTGLQQTINATGRAERSIILYRGSQSETASSMPRAAIQTVLDLPGIKRDEKGNALATADALGSLWLSRLDGSTTGSVILRGVTPEALAVRPEIVMREGHMFEPGLKQLIVGQAAQGRYAGLAIGDKVVDSDNEWTVVGIFQSAGSAHESELWSDTESVLAAFHRNTFNSVTAWTTDDAGFEQLQAAATIDPTLSVDVHRETRYYADQSNEFSGFLAATGTVIASIMAVGAVFGTLNSMYTAVSTRTSEIATLRAIGFGPGCIVMSVFAEAMLLAFIGALLGAGLAWLFFNGNTVSTVSGNGVAQVVFSLHIGVDAMVTGVSWSLVLGLIGGLFPAVRAARLPIMIALRGA